jgi:hypothetical protein
MSGDLMANPANPTNPKKVLGPIWDMAANHLQMDIKVSFSGKEKGVWMVPDVDLEEMDAFTLNKITKRMAQGQYDPQGLLSAYAIMLKLLFA